MRFLHTSDWHVGLKAAWAGDSAPRIVQARLDSFANVGRIAAQHDAEFVLLAGDLFDSHAISLSTARQAVDIIESFPCPVYVIPGNHDQDSPGALWDRLDLDSLSRFHLLRTPEPMPLTGGTLYPCPLNLRWSSTDPLAWIPPRAPNDLIRVALAHGSLDLPHFRSAAQHPIPPDAAARYGLDYVALGDWHSTSIQTNLAYPGAPELTAPDDREPGHVLLVEIQAASTPPEIVQLDSGGISKVAIERFIASEADLSILYEEVAKIASPVTLLNLVVHGTVSSSAQSIIQKLKHLLETEFVWSRFSDSGLLPDGTPLDLPAYFPDVASRLLSLAASDPVQAAAARLALLHLNDGASESGL
jgi:DNA repair exonuclease SbcCD nuclease subunit